VLFPCAGIMAYANMHLLSCVAPRLSSPACRAIPQVGRGAAGLRRSRTPTRRDGRFPGSSGSGAAPRARGRRARRPARVAPVRGPPSRTHGRYAPPCIYIRRCPCLGVRRVQTWPGGRGVCGMAKGDMSCRFLGLRMAGRIVQYKCKLCRSAVGRLVCPPGGGYRPVRGRCMPVLERFGE
jgi:hypothetical protein